MRPEETLWDMWRIARCKKAWGIKAYPGLLHKASQMIKVQFRVSTWGIICTISWRCCPTLPFFSHFSSISFPSPGPQVLFLTARIYLDFYHVYSSHPTTKVYCLMSPMLEELLKITSYTCTAPSHDHPIITAWQATTRLEECMQSCPVCCQASHVNAERIG